MIYEKTDIMQFGGIKTAFLCKKDGKSFASFIY